MNTFTGFDDILFIILSSLSYESDIRMIGGTRLPGLDYIRVKSMNGTRFMKLLIYIYFEIDSHVYVKTTNLASLTRPMQCSSIVQLALKADIK